VIGISSFPKGGAAEQSEMEEEASASKNAISYFI
jgi:hypothetical protein